MSKVHGGKEKQACLGATNPLPAQIPLSSFLLIYSDYSQHASFPDLCQTNKKRKLKSTSSNKKKQSC